MGITSAELRSLRVNAGKPSAHKPRSSKPAMTCNLPPGPISGTIVAFDPSSGNLGWAVVDATPQGPKRITSGCWHPSEAKGASDKFDQLVRFANALFGEDDGRMNVVVELPNTRAIPKYASRSPASILVYGRAVGHVEAVCRLRCPGRVWTPDVQKWKGQKRKGQTIFEVRHRLGYVTANDNEADALGLCLWLCDAVGIEGDRPF
jgi:Holliday junction resolvasome RuvABC endonuclease subunit